MGIGHRISPPAGNDCSGRQQVHVPPLLPSLSVTMNVDCKTALALDDGLGSGDRPQQLVADPLAGMNEGRLSNPPEAHWDHPRLQWAFRCQKSGAIDLALAP